MKLKIIIGILLCLLLIGGAQAAVTHFVQHSGEYTIEIFNGSAGGTTTWTPPPGVSQVEYLVVGGGGSGGSEYAGGGGAGEFRTGTSLTIHATGETITVGSGGASVSGSTERGNKGGNSSLTYDGGTVTSEGGGGGGSFTFTINKAGIAGGSGGGGAGVNGAGGAGTDGSTVPGNYIGHNGATAASDFGIYTAGAGGGGSANVGMPSSGANAGAGGAGTTSNISGQIMPYAAGGGGGAYSGTLGSGGSANSIKIGGDGASVSGTPTAGTANTGSGGGGPGHLGASGAGGSGIVIIRYSAPVASFTSVNVSIATNSTARGWEGLAPFTMSFTNTSTSPPFTSYVWNYYTALGSSTPVTFNQTAYYNPIYTFGSAGNYSIQLNVTGTYGTNISTQTTWINVTQNIFPVASFTQNKTGGQAPLAVLFTDTSTVRPKVWNWSVNASDWSSRTWYNYTTSTNLEYTFPSAGLYNVTLSVQNITKSPAISTVSHDVLVNTTLQADFVGAPLSGTFVPQTVSFVDFSTGAGLYAWSWNFGDGSTSTTRNPTHQYVTAGSFTVSLTTSGADGTSTKTVPNYVVINTGGVFSANKTEASTYGFPVKFTDDYPTGHLTWLWNFGDTYTSTSSSPTHYYSVAGKYTVNLTVTDAFGTNTSTKTSYINLSSDLPNVKSWLHMDGVNGGTTFNGEIGSAWTPTGVTTSTVQKKFGTASALFGSSSKLTTPSSSTFDFGTGDFTIEQQVYPISSGTKQQIISRHTSGTLLNDGWGIYHSTTSGTSNGWVAYFGTTATQTGTFTLPLNTWSHLAIERSAGVVTVYVNGISVASVAAAGNYDTTNPVTFGRTTGSSNSFVGYIDETRISNVARWSPFDPPYAAYAGDLYPVYPDPNPDSTLRFKTNPSFPSNAIMNNLTARYRTVQLQNVTIANNISTVVIFNPLHVFASGVTANATTYSDINFTKVSIDNTIGTVLLNATRPGGFSTDGLAENRASFADIRMVYYNYTAPEEDAMWDEDDYTNIQFFGSGYLKNSTTSTEYPVHKFIATNVSFQDWVTYSDFTANNTAPTVDESTVTFIPELNFTANRYLYNFGDGTTFLSYNTSETHIYHSPGAKTVSLTAYLWQNTSVTNTTTKVGYVTPVLNASYVNANFTATPQSGSAGVLIKFTDNSVWGSTDAVSGRTYNWSFGDGGFSNAKGDASHVYPYLGTFDVNLSINNTLGADYDFKLGYIIISTNQQYAVTYPPKDTRFHLQTIWGTPIVNASVSALPTQTTTGSYTYVAGLYGYQLNTIPLETTTLTGVTDSRGDITFAMMSNVQYGMAYSATGYSFPLNTTITPHDDNYIIYADSTGSPFVANGTSPSAHVTFTVNAIRVNTTYAELTVNYTDTTSATTGGTITIYQSNKTLGYVIPEDPIILNQQAFVANLTSNKYILNDKPPVGTCVNPGDSAIFDGTTYALLSCVNMTLVNDQSWYVKGSGNTATGEVIKQTTVWFKNLNSQLAGFQPEFALFFALGIMMFTALLATYGSAPQVSIAVCFEGWIFYGMNMFSLLQGSPAVSVGPYAMSNDAYVVGVLTLMTLMSIIFNFVAFRRSGK